MGIIAWIVVGAIAGFIATFFLGNREGFVMTIVLGIVGAVVGGFLAGAFLNLKEPMGINIETIVVSVVGADRRVHRELGDGQRSPPRHGSISPPPDPSLEACHASHPDRARLFHPADIRVGTHRADPGRPGCIGAVLQRRHRLVARGAATGTDAAADQPPTPALATFFADGSLIFSGLPVRPASDLDGSPDPSPSAQPEASPSNLLYSSAGQGVWTSTGSVRAALTFVELVSDGTGSLAATVTVSATVKVDESGDFMTGPYSVTSVGPDWGSRCRTPVACWTAGA